MECASNWDNPEIATSANGALKQLRYSLQLLAASAQEQAAHFPPPYFFVFSEEMISDFDHWASCVPTYWKLSQEQIKRLRVLNDFLRQMHWPQQPRIGPDEMLFTDPQWETIRTLAKSALDSCEWPVEVPPPARWDKGVLIDGDYQ